MFAAPARLPARGAASPPRCGLCHPSSQFRSPFRSSRRAWRVRSRRTHRGRPVLCVIVNQRTYPLRISGLPTGTSIRSSRLPTVELGNGDTGCHLKSAALRRATVLLPVPLHVRWRCAERPYVYASLPGTHIQILLRFPNGTRYLLKSESSPLRLVIPRAKSPISTSGRTLQYYPR